jgi:hypothetical protein
MRHTVLGEWGAKLDDGQFACAAIALGILSTRVLPTKTAELIDLLANDDLFTTLNWAAGKSDLVSWQNPDSRASFWREYVPDANKLAEAWLKFRGSGAPQFRLSLSASTLSRPFTSIDATGLPELFALLMHQDARVDAVSVAWRTLRYTGWRWPLRLGYLDDEESTTVAARIGTLDLANKLIRLFPFSHRQNHSDLAVLPASPKQHLDYLLASPYRERTGFVFFVSRLYTPSQDDLKIFETIAKEMRASGFCVIRDASLDPDYFVNEVIKYLSHDIPIDVAIFNAARNSNSHTPILFVDPSYCRRASLSNVRMNMIRTLERAGEISLTITPDLSRRLGIPIGVSQPARLVGRMMKKEITPGRRYTGESITGADLVRMMASLSDSQPSPDEAIIQANAKRGDTRYIQAQINRLTDNKPVRVRALTVGTKHRVQIRIGPFDDAWINPTNLTPFPDKLLPVDEDDHCLKIILSEPYHIAVPLVTEVTIKSMGPSKVATLEFEPRAGNPSFHARVTVAHQNRILQTAILNARVLLEDEQETSEDRVSLEIEAIIRPFLHGLAERSQFDAAFVFNHTPQAQTQILTLSGNDVTLCTNNKLDEPIKSIVSLLSVVASSSEDYSKGLEEKKGIKLLIDLAHEGIKIHNYLIKIDERINAAKYIQIISLSPDDYFPAEFIYEFGLPKQDAELCPVAREAFLKKEFKNPCKPEFHKVQGKGSPYVCPFGFWGLSHIIERHPFKKPPDYLNGKFVLKMQEEPYRGRNILRFNNSAIFACSNNLNDEFKGQDVAHEVYDRLSNCLRIPLDMAHSWSEWEKIISDPIPSKDLLILLPHVIKTPVRGGDTNYSLEIGGDEIDTLLFEDTDAMEKLVRPKNNPPPLVILFGCNSTTPESAIDSIVGKFRSGGAGIVVGTVANVLGSHASKVAEEVVRELVSQGSGDSVPFGQLLLNVRRNALSHGLLMALCIGGFGDADWLIES